MHLLIATAQDDFEWCNNNGMCSCRLFFHDLQYGVSLASEMEPMSTISKAFFQNVISRPAHIFWALLYKHSRVLFTKV